MLSIFHSVRISHLAAHNNKIYVKRAHVINVFVLNNISGTASRFALFLLLLLLWHKFLIRSAMCAAPQIGELKMKTKEEERNEMNEHWRHWLAKMVNKC